MLDQLNRITLTWWVGHALILTMSVGVILAAGLLSPSSEAVSFFGAEVPVLCGWRQMTGLPCMGCGLTRSFTFMAHGQVGAAFQMNLMGPFLFALVASQVPWRSWALYKGQPAAVESAATPESVPS